MALAVVTKASGGLPIRWVSAAPYALPVTEATNGFGIAVTQVSAGGLPVTFVTTSGAIVAPLTPTNWNPSDKSANMSLSNGNLTATSTNFSVGVRAVKGNNSGKFYWEATLANGGSSADDVGLGLATADLTSTAPVGTTAVSLNSIFVNGSSISTFPGMSNGVIVGIAVDLTVKLIWYRNAAAGIWNNNGSANPATGVGGINIASVATGLLFPLFQVGAASGHAATANFGATAFNGAVPSGYTAGWG